jgi:putative FmdB family regulatory protein
MPTYEFRCPLGHEFEKFYRTISGAEAQAACPQCGQIAERMMSATGFAFKGSGFYLTDYGKNAHRGSGDAKAAPAGGAGASEGGGDKPPAAGAGDGGSSSSSSSSSSETSASPGESKKPAAEAKPAPAPPKKSTE